MIIREIHTNEMGFLKEMLYEALYVRENEPPFDRNIVDTPELSKYISQWGRQENDVALVAEKEGVLIGAIWGRTFKPPRTGYGFVNETTPELTMALKNAYRNQGIGSRLLDGIAKYYSKKGISALSLSVDKQNAARRLYERKGFLFFADVGTAVTLMKVL
ncbi:MAG: GNAT family N-acetyltransferase [Saonia sp.]